VKDRNTGTTILRGDCQDGVYPLPQLSSIKKPPALALVGERTSLDLWHTRLGHPSTKTCHFLISRFSLPVSGSNQTLSSLCSACQCNKSHQLYFSKTSLISTHPLEYIYTDIWGPAASTSIDGYRYYALFVDHFTKYCWLFLIHHKNDVRSIFIQLKGFVEKQFGFQIKNLYSDNGGEYQSLRQFLSAQSINMLTIAPHTPQQNGTSERRHRHIIETGLMLLHQAHLPMSYWTHAFQTAIYLINVLNNKSPFESIFGRQPNYHKLRTFGC
jgi:transposase InsO family protein